jgi:predicted lactoylglutathione lyase
VATIDSLVLEVEDTAAAELFLKDAFGLGDVVTVRESSAPTTGFRGFAVSLVVGQPSTVDSLFASAVAAGATATKQPSKSFWGYGAAVQAPDGTTWTLASSSKKETGPATREVDDVVLLLGVEDVKASKQFYVDRGLTVAKSYGGKYAELESGDRVKLALSPRKVAAKNAGVPIEGSGSHRLVVSGDVGGFADPDGFAWETTSA